MNEYVLQRELNTLHVIKLSYNLKQHCKKRHFVPNRYIYLKQIISFKVIATIWNESKLCFAVKKSF